MTERPFQTHDVQDEMDALMKLLGALPIYATRIGYRDDSTDEQRKFADSLFDVSAKWAEVRP